MIMKCYKHNQIQVRRKNKRSKSIHKDQRNSHRKSNIFDKCIRFYALYGLLLSVLYMLTLILSGGIYGNTSSKKLNQRFYVSMQK